MTFNVDWTYIDTVQIFIIQQIPGSLCAAFGLPHKYDNAKSLKRLKAQKITTTLCRVQIIRWNYKVRDIERTSFDF